MKVTLTAAVTLDGFIADSDGGTEWVNDWDLFEKTSKEYGCTVMGRSTYEEGGSTFEECQHIVISSKKLASKNNIHFVDSANGAIEEAKQLGFEQVLVIGGSKTFESFIRDDKFDRLLLDMHPILLGQGIRLFGDFIETRSFKLISTQRVNDYMRLEYNHEIPKV